MIYYLFRHGETYDTKYRIPYDDKTVVSSNILPESKSVIKRLANYLKNKDTDYSVSSPVKRCKQTVEVIKEETGIAFMFDKRLTEYYNEPFEQMVDRLKNFLKESKEKGFKSMAVCSHGEPISALINLLTKGSFSEADLHQFPPTGVLVKVAEGNTKFIDFNEKV